MGTTLATWPQGNRVLGEVVWHKAIAASMKGNPAMRQVIDVSPVARRLVVAAVLFLIGIGSPALAASDVPGFDSWLEEVKKEEEHDIDDLINRFKSF